LTDRRLNEAIVQSGSRCPDDAYAACGCRAKCGKCAKAIAELLRNHEHITQPDLQSVA
jgi:bacterioferritin-associated ferredoxin